MREDEANFIGYLACKDASDPLTRYSGYSLAYDYALSALVKADRDTAVTVNDKLSEEVKADRRARSEYLRQFERSCSRNVERRQQRLPESEPAARWH